jgi:hypothetical protein
VTAASSSRYREIAHRRARILPGSQIDVVPRNLDALRGRELHARHQGEQARQYRAVAQALLQEENAEKKKHTLGALAEARCSRAS